MNVVGKEDKRKNNCREGNIWDYLHRTDISS